MSSCRFCNKSYIDSTGRLINTNNINSHEECCKKRIFYNNNKIDRYLNPSNRTLEATKSNKRSIHDIENEPTDSNEPPSKMSIVETRKCRGFQIENFDVWNNFPLQVFGFEKGFNFILENESFHHKDCYNNHYKLDPRLKLEVNPACDNLRYSKHLKRLLNRQNETSKSLNYQHMTFQQLRSELHEKSKQINDLKLNILNLQYTVLLSQQKQFQTNDVDEYSGPASNALSSTNEDLDEASVFKVWDTNIQKLPCVCNLTNGKKCNHEVKPDKMRQHVGLHILLGEIDLNLMTCGFCGLNGCRTKLIITSGRGKSATWGPHSDCKYFKAFALKPSASFSKSSPCTNRPVNCTICDETYWSYNIYIHYNEKHSGVECPFLINEEEKSFVLKYVK